ncbi:uncharacterized protein LOC133625779 isoform X2 [Colius striatus]|uniref:uncharacterized protein LOC133625779 isoform X2 n=1 Tax=Colius striatus TaxID=57412 RepID=UPI002B1CFDBF|nr:uncharacterized protein LOC133625779 isoform X2 [Colius striatus]
MCTDALARGDLCLEVPVLQGLQGTAASQTMAGGDGEEQQGMPRQRTAPLGQPVGSCPCEAGLRPVPWHSTGPEGSQSWELPQRQHSGSSLAAEGLGLPGRFGSAGQDVAAAVSWCSLALGCSVRRCLHWALAARLGHVLQGEQRGRVAPGLPGSVSQAAVRDSPQGTLCPPACCSEPGGTERAVPGRSTFSLPSCCSSTSFRGHSDTRGLHSFFPVYFAGSSLPVPVDPLLPAWDSCWSHWQSCHGTALQPPPSQLIPASSSQLISAHPSSQPPPSQLIPASSSQLSSSQLSASPSQLIPALSLPFPAHPSPQQAHQSGCCGS